MKSPGQQTAINSYLSNVWNIITELRDMEKGREIIAPTTIYKTNITLTHANVNGILYNYFV